MNRRIIYSRPDGGVNIVIPCRCIEDEHLTDDQIVKRSWERLPREAGNPQIITMDELPPDRTYRNAWEHAGDKVQVNMDGARGIQMDRIRAARDVALKALDTAIVIAVGKGDTKALTEIEAQKQVLRDIPQTVDLTKAATPEELKEIWPEELAK